MVQFEGKNHGSKWIQTNDFSSILRFHGFFVQPSFRLLVQQWGWLVDPTKSPITKCHNQYYLWCLTCGFGCPVDHLLPICRLKGSDCKFNPSPLTYYAKERKRPVMLYYIWRDFLCFITLLYDIGPDNELYSPKNITSLENGHSYTWWDWNQSHISWD